MSVNFVFEIFISFTTLWTVLSDHTGKKEQFASWIRHSMTQEIFSAGPSWLSRKTFCMYIPSAVKDFSKGGGSRQVRLYLLHHCFSSATNNNLPMTFLQVMFTWSKNKRIKCWVELLTTWLYPTAPVSCVEVCLYFEHCEMLMWGRVVGQWPGPEGAILWLL